MKTKWEKEVPLITEMVDKGVTLQDIGDIYGVSKQRMYQVLNQFNIPTLERQRSRMMKKYDDPRMYWLNRILTNNSVSKKDRIELLTSMDIPDVCPCLGTTLDYGSKGAHNRLECSPSVDKVVPDKGFVKGNLFIISWRASRIKNDSTHEELLAISNWVKEKVGA